MDWSGVDYCDVFISCLDSHSDGTHSLLMDLFQLLSSQDVNWWTGVVWIIVMLLSAVWTLILTAPIHFRASDAMLQYLFRWKNKLICIFDGLMVSKFTAMFWLNYSFNGGWCTVTRDVCIQICVCFDFSFHVFVSMCDIFSSVLWPPSVFTPLCFSVCLCPCIIICRTVVWYWDLVSLVSI